MGFEMVMTRNEPIVAKPVVLHRKIMLGLEDIAQLPCGSNDDLLIFVRGRLTGKLENLRGAVIPADHRRMNRAIRAAGSAVLWNEHASQIKSTIAHVNREARRHKAKRAAAKKSGGDKKPASKDPPSLGSSG
jgi:hypothetical protein